MKTPSQQFTARVRLAFCLWVLIGAFVVLRLRHLQFPFALFVGMAVTPITVPTGCCGICDPGTEDQPCPPLLACTYCDPSGPPVNTPASLILVIITNGFAACVVLTQDSEDGCHYTATVEGIDAVTYDARHTDGQWIAEIAGGAYYTGSASDSCFLLNETLTRTGGSSTGVDCKLTCCGCPSCCPTCADEYAVSGSYAATATAGPGDDCSGDLAGTILCTGGNGSCQFTIDYFGAGTCARTMGGFNITLQVMLGVWVAGFSSDTGFGVGAFSTQVTPIACPTGAFSTCTFTCSDGTTTWSVVIIDLSFT